MLRSLFIVGGLAGTFGMGYLLQGSRDSSKTNAVQVTANRQSAAPSAAENAEPAGDPSLKLPDRLPDADGVTFDASFQAIKGHYKELAKPLIPAAEQISPVTSVSAHSGLAPGTEKIARRSQRPDVAAGSGEERG